MKSLAHPGFQDRNIVAAICGEKGWTATAQADWLAVYRTYSRRKGDLRQPYARPSSLNAVQKELYDLYDSARGKRLSGEVRRDPVGSCPMCGSAHTGTVDHFLPRDTFPELAIFGHNLIPACAACNMFAKRTQSAGKLRSDKLVHPYFEKLIASTELWHVEFLGPLDAVVIEPKPLPLLSPYLQSRVRYHLSVVLKNEFEKAMTAEWTEHAEALAKEALEAGHSTVTVAFVYSETQRQKRWASKGGGHNSWSAAFYRGVLNNSAVQAYFAAWATRLI